MSDAQDESPKVDPETENPEAIEKEVVMDEVAEARSPAAKKSCYTGTLFFLVLLGALAGAGWYYQAMWLPQAQEKIQQAQAWLNSMMPSDEAPDLRMAPKPAAQRAETAVKNDKPNYVVSAILDPEPEMEKEIPAEVAENNRVAAKEVTVVEPANEIVTQAANADMEETGTMLANATPVAKVPAIAGQEHVASPVMVPEAAEKNNMATMAGKPAEAPMPIQSENRRPAIDLDKARQAFWQRDLPRAEALYKEQLNRFGDGADSWGELGNVYYFQAKWPQAAAAYTEAALILLNKGDIPQAMFLRYIIIGLDPTQARRIDERLQALQAPLKG